MKDGLKILKIVALILIVILLSIIAYGGLYQKQNNVWKKISSDVNVGMELGDTRQITFKYGTHEEEKEIYVDENGKYMGDVKTSSPASDLSLETTDGTASKETDNTAENTADDVKYEKVTRVVKENDDSLRNIASYEKAKKIIKKRINDIGTNIDYDIRIDSETGDLVIETTNNDDVVGKIEQAVVTRGDFKVIDEQTGVILLTKDDVEYASAGIYQLENLKYQTALSFTMTSEGSAKLKDISNRYRAITKSDGTTETKYVSIYIDDSKIHTTYFGVELSGGVLQIPVGNEADTTTELTETREAAQELSELINQETMPIVYDVATDILYKNNISYTAKMVAVICFIVFVVVASIFLIVKFKKLGLMMSIINAGFIAASIIVIRKVSSDIPITINSLIAFVVLVFANICFSYLYLKNRKENSIIKELYWETMMNYYLAIIPLAIVAFFCTFASAVSVSSIGLVIVYGLLVQFLYNLITIRAMKLV